MRTATVTTQTELDNALTDDSITSIRIESERGVWLRLTATPANKTVEAWDLATVRAGGSATVEAGGLATVEAWDSATVKEAALGPGFYPELLRDMATARARWAATIRANNGSTT